MVLVVRGWEILNLLLFSRKITHFQKATHEWKDCLDFLVHRLQLNGFLRLVQASPASRTLQGLCCGAASGL